MKKVVYILTLTVATLFMNNNVNAQAFQKGNANLDVGFGLGAYKTVATYTIPGFTILNIQFPSTTVTNEDGASSFMVPLTFEYGISNKIGLGVQLGFSNYFIDNEDSTETLESVKSIDFAFLINFHLSQSEKNDLFIGIALGGSNVNWKDLSGLELTGTGGLFKFYLTDRLFFTDHIGMLFNIGYALYTYNEITSSENSNGPIVSTLKWKLGGLNLGTGLAVKF